MTPTFLRLPDLCACCGLRRSTAYEWIRAGKLPRPVKLGRSSGWLEHEIHAVLDAVVRGEGEDERRTLVAQLHAARGALTTNRGAPSSNPALVAGVKKFWSEVRAGRAYAPRDKRRRSENQITGVK